MPRFYSAEWVEAFNTAVSDLPEPGDDERPARDLRVAQLVRGAPEEVAGDGSGELRVVLEVVEGRLALRRGNGTTDEDDADVTVLLSYDDAVALSTGALDPPRALAEGRIRVRGNLAALATGQALLAGAASRLGELRAATTY